MITERCSGDDREWGMCFGTRVSVQTHRDTHNKGPKDDSEDCLTPKVMVNKWHHNMGCGWEYHVSPTARIVLPVSQLWMLIISLNQ